LIRILAGAMLLYTHFVWTIDLDAFFGPRSWVSPSVNDAILSMPDITVLKEQDPYGGQRFAWTLFDIVPPSWLWSFHIGALVVFAMLTVGLLTRWASILAWVLAVSYVQRAQGALFGLDQINTMLAMYLMVGPSGACYSLDAWLARRRSANVPKAIELSTAANVAVRLIQVHMCVIYMFAGIGKFVGVSWWNGTGLWGGIANLEYQSLDATWLAYWPHLSAFLSHFTVYWEVFYCVLIWPRATRPWMLLLAIPLHLGIAFFMGMITFGLVMLIGNFAFVRPETTRAMLCWLFRRTARPQWHAANAMSKTGKALA
jgi:hypothetical protein